MFNLRFDFLLIFRLQRLSLKVGSNSFLSQELLICDLEVVLPLDLLNIFFQQVDLFSQSRSLLVTLRRICSHKYSRGGLKLSSRSVIVDLNALWLEDSLVFVLDAEDSFTFNKVAFGTVSKLFAVNIEELLIDHSFVSEALVVSKKFLQFLRASSDLTFSVGWSLYLIEIGKMLGDGVFVEYLSSRESVLNLILLRELLIW